ncbi:MAG: hypothetical protein HYY96_03865 [Candidatus Tectomicrobia bacterium]|nr:hypothetical protein [Candidatus Tectomicrobia bacterium]
MLIPRFDGHAKRIRHAADEGTLSGDQGDIKDLLVGEAMLAQRSDVLLLDRMRCHQDLLREIKHRHIGRRQPRGTVIRVDA